MNLNKTFLTLGLAATLLQMPASSFAQNAGGNRQNPLLVKSSLPFGAPDFSKIQESDYLPAIETAIKEQRANIQKIVNNKKKPTFQNTILAYENSGMLLERVSSVFFGLTSAHKTPGIADTQKKVMPLLTNLDNEISFNQKLFERIKYVYDNEYKKLKGEDKRLTEVIYKSFVRSGALPPRLSASFLHCAMSASLKPASSSLLFTQTTALLVAAGRRLPNCSWRSEIRELICFMRSIFSGESKAPERTKLL